MRWSPEQGSGAESYLVPAPPGDEPRAMSRLAFSASCLCSRLLQSAARFRFLLPITQGTHLCIRKAKHPLSQAANLV